MRERLADTIQLGPLAEAETGQLVSALAGDLPDTVVRALAEQTAGNPFFIEELILQLSGSAWRDSARTPQPHAEEAAWRLTDTGWIYLVADADRAGKALLTLLVDNLDEQVAALPERGLAPTETETLPDAGRKATFVDAEGNRITFAQPGRTDG